MPAAQLKETTMSPKTRNLIRVTLPDAMEALGVVAELNDDGTPTNGVDDLVERLMGKNAESRFLFIQENAQFVQDIDV
jgi:topoisomerase-4 subunit B